MFDRRLFDAVARQHGVVSADQLRAEFGRSRSSIDRARRGGTLAEVAPGVYRIAAQPETYRMRCMAVLLQIRGAGFLSGWTAGRLYELRRMPSTRIHLTVDHRFRAEIPDWVDLHRSRWYDHARDSRTSPDGLVVATPMRMLFGLAAAFNQFRFERAAEDAWHRELITPSGAADYLQRHRCRGKDGVRRFEAWLDKALPRERPSQSGLEQDLLEALALKGLPDAVRQHPLVLPTGDTIHFDIAWPDIRLAVEPGHSWWHGGDLQQRLDQARDRSCSELGWLVVRFDESMRQDLSGSADQVARIHRRRTDDVQNVRGLSR